MKLGSILAPFLKHSVVQMDNSALILANVESHIPRPVLDGVIKTPNDVLQEFLNLLEERQTARSMSKTNIQVLYSEMPPNIKPLFRRLASEGMVPNVEDKLLFMKENLIKISKHRAMKQSNVDEYFSVLDLNNYNKVIKRCIPLNIQEKSDLEMAQDSDVVVGGEWNAGTLEPETGIEQAETAESGTTPNDSRKSISEEVPDYPAFLHETKTSSFHASCKLELEETISKKRCQYAMTSRQRRNIERGLTEKNFPTSSWRPKGTLVAHLHEHQV